VQGLEGRGWAWWLGAGTAAGCALLSKYSAALTLIGALLYLLTQPHHRHWLARPQPYVAALLALLLFSPVLAWNSMHGWASFAFQGERAMAYRFNPFGPVTALAGEALYLVPWIWFFLIVEFVRGLRAGPADWRRWLPCWLAAGPIVFFPVIAVWSRGGQFHWAAPGYLFLFPLVGARLVHWRPAVARGWLCGSAALVCVGMLLAASEVQWNWIGLIRPGADPGLQAVNWTPLRGALQSRGLLERAVIAAPNWRDAGKIDYALGGDPPVLCLNTDARQYGFSPGPATHIGQDVLIVAPGQTTAQIGEAYGAVFDRIEPLAPASMQLPGRGAVDFPLYLGHHLLRWP
jgi:4-amino-4-deoxy-L-arabinose transferase-like glycosyltransferase